MLMMKFEIAMSLRWEASIRAAGAHFDVARVHPLPNKAEEMS